MSRALDPTSRLATLRAAGVDAHPSRSRRTHTLAGLDAALAAHGDGPSCGLGVREGAPPHPVVAGRLQSVDGEAVHLADLSGARLLPLAAPAPAHLEVGDLVEAEIDPALGAVTALRLLAPALPPAPAPAPLADAAPGGGATLATLRRRAQLLHALRTWFVGQGFLEVETPALAAAPGLEPHLDPFETSFRPFPGADGRPLWLLTSPEYAMKRLLVAGVERCFQVSRVFRNGEAGPMHNPEFTMLEWYRAHASYLDILADTEDLILHLARAVGQPLRLSRQGATVDLSPPWERLSVRDAVVRYAGFDLADTPDAPSLRAAAAAAGVTVPADAPWDEAFFRVLLERVEPRLGFDRPTFLMDYPASLAALSRVRPEPYPVAERFELYIAGVEIANAFSELTDPVEQAGRFAEEQAQRAALGAPVFQPDEDYLAALARGLPPTGGIALGVDRLAMVLLGAPDVRGVLAFPFAG